jgi:hypothetical protein
MKKFVLFSLVLVLAFAVVSAALQAQVNVDSAYQTGVCTKVGWNTRVACTANISEESMQPVAALVRPPVYKPDVGWNS